MNPLKLRVGAFVLDKDRVEIVLNLPSAGGSAGEEMTVWGLVELADAMTAKDKGGVAAISSVESKLQDLKASPVPA